MEQVDAAMGRHMLTAESLPADHPVCVYISGSKSIKCPSEIMHIKPSCLGDFSPVKSFIPGLLICSGYFFRSFIAISSPETFVLVLLLLFLLYVLKFCTVSTINYNDDIEMSSLFSVQYF